MGRIRLVVLGSTLSLLGWGGCSAGTGVDPIAPADAGSAADATGSSDGAVDGATQTDGDPADDASADAANDADSGQHAVDGAFDAGTDADATATSQCIAGEPSAAPGDDSDGDGVADEDDCDPCAPDVFPDAGAWHGDARADGSWDFNCDGAEELEYPTKGKCVGAPSCTPQPQGFYDVPPCGARGELIAYCLSYQYSCGTQYQPTNSTQQRCR